MQMKTLAAAAALTAVVETAAGCREDVDLSTDPNGQEACDQLVVALENSDDLGKKAEALMLAAEAAEDAETTAIKEAVNEPIEGLEDFPTVDIAQLSAACADAGVDVPEGLARFPGPSHRQVSRRGQRGAAPGPRNSR